MSINKIFLTTLTDSLKNVYFYLIIVISFLVMFLNRSIILFKTINFGEYGQVLSYIITITFYIFYTIIIVAYLHSIFKNEPYYSISSPQLFIFLFLNFLKMALIFVVPMITISVFCSTFYKSDFLSLPENTTINNLKLIFMFFLQIFYCMGSALVLVKQTSFNSVKNTAKLITTKVFLITLLLILLFNVIYVGVDYILNEITNIILNAILNYGVNILYRILIPFSILFISKILLNEDFSKTSPNSA